MMVKRKRIDWENVSATQIIRSLLKRMAKRVVGQIQDRWENIAVDQNNVKKLELFVVKMVKKEDVLVSVTRKLITKVTTRNFTMCNLTILGFCKDKKDPVKSFVNAESFLPPSWFDRNPGRRKPIPKNLKVSKLKGFSSNNAFMPHCGVHTTLGQNHQDRWHLRWTRKGWLVAGFLKEKGRIEDIVFDFYTSISGVNKPVISLGKMI